MTFAIDPNPRDGEQITSAEIRDGCLYVHKETRIYVFYGTSTEPDGTPSYDYFVRPRS